MAKRRHERSSRHDNGNVGCMWAWISMFNFRQGHFARKILSDRRHGIVRHAGNVDSQDRNAFVWDSKETHEDCADRKENEGKPIESSMASVKALIDKEMSITPRVKITSDELEHFQPDFGIEAPMEKVSKRTNRCCKVASDIIACEVDGASNLGPHKECSSNPSQRTSFDYDLASFMMDFYSNKNRHEEHANSSLDLCTEQESGLCGEDAHCKEINLELVQAHANIQKALNDVASLLLQQKSISPKSFVNKEIIQSNEFMDALEVLSSNKDIFLKILQDPNSFMSKHIKDIQIAQPEKPPEASIKDNGKSGKSDNPYIHEVFPRQSVYKFFRRKDTVKEAKAMKNTGVSRALNKIVILKPTPASPQNLPVQKSQYSQSLSKGPLNLQKEHDGPALHFSFKEMKERLKHAIGATRMDRHLVSRNEVPHKVSYVSKDLDKGKSNLEGTSMPASFYRRGSKKTKPKYLQTNTDKEESPKDNFKRMNMNKAAHSVQRDPFLHEEARNHLAEILESGDKKYMMPDMHVSEKLARMLHLPHYSLVSPTFSPLRDSLSPRKILSSAKLQCTEESTENTNLELVGCLPSHESNLVNKSQVADPTDTLDDKYTEATCLAEGLNMEGSTKIVFEVSKLGIDECDHLDEPLNSGSIEAMEDEKWFLPMLEQSSEKSWAIFPSVSTQPPSLMIHKDEDHESIIERLDRPSPLSVLEPFFMDDTISPEHEAAEPEKRLQTPQLSFEDENIVSPTLPEFAAPSLITRLHDKEAKFNYIRTVMELSGLFCNVPSKRWNSTNLLLDPSLFDELLNTPLPEDAELLFDAINEVLEEIQGKFFDCTPWVALIRKEVQGIPKGGDIVEKVCRRVDWHLQIQFPTNLEQIVGKDLDGLTWMDLRLDTEDVVSDTGDAILDYVMEETILELWE